MANEYDYGQYASYSQDPEFRRLQAQFSGAFGSSFPTFSYEAFLNDPSYARRIYEQAGRDPSRAPVLNELLEFFKGKTEGSTYDKSGGAIDAEAIFGPLRDEIRQLTEQQIRLGRSEISQGSARATSMATESLAGTGLGRSGVAAQTFGNIAQERERKMESLGQEARLRETQALLGVEQQIADTRLADELRKRGMNEEDIRGALNFQRQLMSMQYQTMLEMAAQDDGSFWDDWGPVFETAAGIVSIL